MVAEALIEAKPALKRHDRAFDLRVVSQVRTLYLVQGLSPKTIEGMGLGLTAMQVSQMAKNHGWAAERRTALSKAEQSTRASADESVTRVAEAIAIESEELCFKALAQTREGLDKGGLEGAKQAQAASSALRNLNSVAQSIRKPELANAENAPTSFNLFFIGSPSKVEAKQVTEVDAKTVQ